MSTFKKRIDELGRIVIPKQIRNSFKINNFDELELFVEKDFIILKKSVGIELYKEKLERFVSFLSGLLDFRIVITDKNNVIASNYEGISYRNEFIINTDENGFIETPRIKGYIEKYPLIIDSNTIGNVYFINKDKFDKNKELLKNIRDLFIDLIN